MGSVIELWRFHHKKVQKKNIFHSRQREKCTGAEIRRNTKWSAEKNMVDIVGT